MTGKTAIISTEVNDPPDLLKIFKSMNEWRGYTIEVTERRGIIVFMPQNKSFPYFFVAVIRGNTVYINKGAFLAKEILEQQGVPCKIIFETDLPPEPGEAWEEAKTRVLE